LSVQDQANATQQWDFGIIGEGDNNFTVRDRTNTNVWTFDTDGNLTIPGGLIGSGASPAPYISGFSSISSITLSASGNANISGNLILSSTTQIVSTPGSNGNITLGPDGTGVVNVLGNVVANVLVGGTVNAALHTSYTSSWTLATGTNTVNINVPLNGTYSIWVNGNIPNGIVTYTATAVVTNTNVPVLGEQYGWYYVDGNALVLTSIPNQFVGTQGAISNASPYSGNTANVFTFGITNNSGANAVVNYGYTRLG
jgi:hypothetical protein